MTFAGVNYIAVVLAALASFALGMGWYMVFAKAWMKAVGKTEKELAKTQGPARSLPFIIFIAAALVMAWMLAGLMGHLGVVTVRGGLITGFFVWVGFVITTMGVNHAFQGAPPALTAIDGLYWLAVLLVMGAVIGAFGV